ncbi:MAG: restriction endonuclease [Novosphingobium sp.]|nr:restriction endonuclease [Novosphingobium sp.]
MQLSELPKYHQFLHPLLSALDEMGGSGATSELNDSVIRSMRLSDEALDVQYPSGNGAVVPDRISWARSYLKKAGLVASQGRGVWLITDDGRDAMGWSAEALKRHVETIEYRKRPDKKPSIDVTSVAETDSQESEDIDWRDQLLGTLRSMDPAAFERLAQRLLRESGFIKVEVTGRSGDGGIDGTGILQISLMSFHVLFQCKRYQGSVGSGAVRDFRGAMIGRTDKGLIITTGMFSPMREEKLRETAPRQSILSMERPCVRN